MSKFKGYRTSLPLILSLLDSDSFHLPARSRIRFKTGALSDSAETTVLTDDQSLSELRVRQALQKAGSSVDVNGQRITNVAPGLDDRANVVTALQGETLAGDLEASFESYADAGDDATLTSAKAYTDSNFDSFESYVDDQDSAVLAEAQSYVDSFDLDISLSSKAFTSSGSWVCPAGVTQAIVMAWGGGGQGGGGRREVTGPTANNSQAGTGGGGSRKRWFRIFPTPGQTYTITLGAGGTGAGLGATTANTNGADGANGSDTTMTGTGVSITAKGAKGGRGGGTTANQDPGGPNQSDLPYARFQLTSTPTYSSNVDEGWGGINGGTAGQAGFDGTTNEGMAGGAGAAGGTGPVGNGGGGSGGGAGPGGVGGAGGKGGDGSVTGGTSAGSNGSAPPTANSGAGGGGGGGGGAGTVSGASTNGGNGADGSAGYLEIVFREP